MTRQMPQADSVVDLRKQQSAELLCGNRYGSKKVLIMNNVMLSDTNSENSEILPTSGRLVVFDRQLGKTRPIVVGDPIFSSDNGRQGGFQLECLRLSGHELEDVQAPCSLIIMHTGAPARVNVRTDGAFEAKIFQNGDLAIIPAGSRFSIRVMESSEFLVISLEDGLVTHAQKAAGADVTELEARWCCRDSFVSETLQDLRHTMEQDRSTDQLYAETLATSLALHLLRSSRKGTASRRGKGGHGLSRPQLESTIEFIQNTPYRENHTIQYGESGGIESVPFLAHVQAIHRAFPTSVRSETEVGTLVHKLWQRHGLQSPEIAGKLGFADQSHFTMHFKRLHGVAPAAYRRQCQS